MLSTHARAVYVGAGMFGTQGAPGLHGRHRECEALDRLLAGVRAGQSSALVLRGEAGVGKTALLDYVVGRASECRIAQAAGVESEMELAFAGGISSARRSLEAILEHAPSKSLELIAPRPLLLILAKATRSARPT